MNIVSGGKSIKSIKNLCDKFEVKNPTMITTQEKSSKVEIMKSFSKDSVYSKFVQDLGLLNRLENHENEDFLVLLNNIT